MSDECSSDDDMDDSFINDGEPDMYSDSDEGMTLIMFMESWCCSYISLFSSVYIRVLCC